MNGAAVELKAALQAGTLDLGRAKVLLVDAPRSVLSGPIEQAPHVSLADW